MQRVDDIPRPPKRSPADHKGTYGHLMVLAGSRRMSGAAVLATGAGLRSGVGLVTLGVPAVIHHLVAPALPSAMTLPLTCNPEGVFRGEAIDPVLEFAERATACAVGPGLTTEPAAAWFAREVAFRVPIPTVIDADGLNALDPTRSLAEAAAPRILTPHPGEAGRLLCLSAREVQADREGAAEEIANRFGAVVVLKGHATIVTDGERMAVNDTGNPGMATGGTGDVLTGLVGGLLAQGMEPFDAARLGVWLHGRAGDLVADRIGPEALTAADLIGEIGPAFRSLSGI